VLSILQVETKEEAIAIENASPFGNAAAIYTTSGLVAEWFTERFSTGMVGVNIGIPVPREPFSFGGVNDSRWGSQLDITGEGGVELFTYRKKVTFSVRQVLSGRSRHDGPRVQMGFLRVARIRGYM